MRLVTIGPSMGDLGTLSRAMVSALTVLHGDRIIYLGMDDSFDCVVGGWAAALNLLEPITSRAMAMAKLGNDELLAALEREQIRLEFERFQALPFKGACCIEILASRLILLVDDTKHLGEEDLRPTSLIVVGQQEPMSRKVGSRLFLAPGATQVPNAGIVVLDEPSSNAQTTMNVGFYDVDGVFLRSESFDLQRAAKVRVQSSPGS